MRRGLIFLLFLFLCGCTPSPLFVQTQTLSKELLASHHVNTPDPHLEQPDWGQRLLIQWSLPRSTPCEQFKLLATIRFRNREEKTFFITLQQSKGSYRFEVLNEDYCRLGGISTYKVAIFRNGDVYKEWKHPLWTDLIKLEN